MCVPWDGGFAHVSCLAEQAKILVAEAEDNNLDMEPKWRRWHSCSMCEQRHYGVVLCALGWACWKTYVGRPEEDWARLKGPAMTLLGNGLSAAKHYEDALAVFEAELATLRRLGASEGHMLITQGNLANTYHHLGRLEDSIRVQQDIYSGHVRLRGEESEGTLAAAHNYASFLSHVKRYAEAKPLLRKTIPVARRVLGENHDLTLRMSLCYAVSLYLDRKATLEDLREAATALEGLERTTRRVMGGAHPRVGNIELVLRHARETLRAHEEANSLRQAMAPPEK